ncbi:MAG TPA: diguanylate cyclase [Clostridiales bacterium]|nr:diguanylate cyclase [Clostridiales bacterium]
MWKYILKRVIISIVILFFVAFVIYAIMRLMPTSYVESIARQRASLPGSKSYTEWLAQLNAIYNLDKGLIQGFFLWMGQAIQGNFGDSWFWNVPVTEKFSEVIWYSFVLGMIAFILELIIAIPLGILAARKQYSRTDYAVSVFALIGISLPTFFFATVLKLIFSIKLGWFDLYGIVGRYYEQLDPIGKLLDMGQHLIMPIMTLVIISVGSLMRFTRTNMLEVLSADFIRTARAKGLSENRVINYHAFRNTLIPIVTIIGGTLPGLFSGALITETLFQIPGIGYTSYQSMVSGDIPFSMFYLVFMAFLTLLGTLIADILYAVVDPRVRIS